MKKIKPYLRKVQFYETDQTGIVHHSNHIRWFEEARVDFLEQVGYSYQKASESGVHVVATGLSCAYKGMARFGDTVKVVLEILLLSSFRITVGYKIFNGEQLCAEGETGHCFYDTRNNKLVSLKKELPELYEILASFQKEAE